MATMLAIRDAMMRIHFWDRSSETSDISVIDDIEDLTQYLDFGHVSAQDVGYAYISHD